MPLTPFTTFMHPPSPLLSPGINVASPTTLSERMPLLEQQQLEEMTLDMAYMCGQLFAQYLSSLLTAILPVLNLTITTIALSLYWGPDALEQFSIAMSLVSVTGFGICVGLLSGLFTLGPEAFDRDPSGRELTAWTQCALFITLVVASLIISFWIFGSWPLLHAIFSEAFAKEVYRILTLSSPLLILTCIFLCLVHGFRAQRLPTIVTYASIGSVLSSPIFNLLLTTRLGCDGAVLSMTLSCCVAVFMITVPTLYHPESVYRYSQWPFEEGAVSLQSTKKYLAASYAMMLESCSERCVLDAFTLMATQIPSHHAIAQVTIVTRLESIFFSLAIAMPIGSAPLIRAALQENKPRAARIYAILSLVFMSLIVAACEGLTLCFSNLLFQLFTSDLSLLCHLSTLVPTFLLILWSDSFAGGLKVMFCGANRQTTAAIASAAAMWICGIASGYFFGIFLSWGALGLLWGFALGSTAVSLLLLLLMLYWDWSKLAMKASLWIPGDF